MHAPDPGRVHPVEGAERVVFLKPIVQNPKVEVGEYTYYDDVDDPLAESLAVSLRVRP